MSNVIFDSKGSPAHVGDKVRTLRNLYGVDFRSGDGEDTTIEAGTVGVIDDIDATEVGEAVVNIGLHRIKGGKWDTDKNTFVRSPDFVLVKRKKKPRR